MNFVDDVIQRFPFGKPALLTIDAAGERRVWHFSEMFAMSAGLSGALAARGVHREDVVMTLVGSRVEWVLSMLACFRMGAVAMPCNPQLRRKDLELRVEAAKPVLCIGEERYRSELPPGVPTLGMEELAGILDEDLQQEPPAEAADLDPADPALIIFTSGTSGDPRGVLYPQRYLAGQSLQAEHWFGAREGELAWCTAAPGWSKSARNIFIAPWLCGAAAMLHDGRFDPRERLELIEREGVNVLCQAPTEYRMLAKRAELRPIPSLRRLVSAGEPLNPEVIRLFRDKLGIPIHDGYGQTETGAIAGGRPGEDDPAKDGSMGRPLPGIETRIQAAPDAKRRRLRSVLASYMSGRRASRLSSTTTWASLHSTANGGRPATRSARTTTATSGSRAATTTSSSPPATGSVPSRSNQRCSATRPSPRQPPSPTPILSAARSCGRSWSRATARAPMPSPPSSRNTSSR